MLFENGNIKQLYMFFEGFIMPSPNVLSLTVFQLHMAQHQGGESMKKLKKIKIFNVNLIYIILVVMFERGGCCVVK